MVPKAIAQTQAVLKDRTTNPYAQATKPAQE